MAASSPSKDTIYIDVDDEITGIIDKLRTSDSKIVALVLPKRASVFQSIVNMKLLKRAADADKKHLVLITSEAGLLPLAGLAGVLVASTLTSKPAVPVAPNISDNEFDDIADENADLTDESPELSPDTPVGVLAGLPVAAAASTAPILTPPSDEVETIDMNDDDAVDNDSTADATGAGTAAAAAPKIKKDKKLAVPNFDRFRLLLIGGGVLLLLLIVGSVLAFSILPKATIAITTDATSVNTNLSFTADTAATTYNATTKTLPAKAVTQQKTYTQQAATTGQKNTGTKASGNVTVSLTNCNVDTVIIPGGTGISANGLTYISQGSVTLSSIKVAGKCNPSAFSSVYSGNVNVIANTGGANFNLASGVTMSVASGQDYKSSDISASTNGNIGGGTDNIIKVVSQSDVDNAKAKINATDPTVKQALTTQLVQMGLYPLAATFVANDPTVTTSSNVGDQADNLTVTETVNNSMLGVQQTDLKALVDADVKKQIDAKKQNILDEGLRGATITSTNPTDKNAQVSVQTVAVAGPQLSVASIKANAAGKKSGDVQASLKSNPDVTGVDVKLSPFFVSHVPKNQSKITVTIAKPKVTVSPKNGNTAP